MCPYITTALHEWFMIDSYVTVVWNLVFVDVVSIFHDSRMDIFRGYRGHVHISITAGDCSSSIHGMIHWAMDWHRMVGRWQVMSGSTCPSSWKIGYLPSQKNTHFGPQEEQKRNDRFQDNIKKAGVLRATVLSLSNWRDSEWVMIQNGSCGMEMYGVWTQRPSCFTLCVHVDAGRLTFFVKLHIQLNWYVPFSAEYVYTSVYLLP